MTLEIIVIILLFIGNVAQLLASQFERKDMLDRLMAKNLVEYKDNSVVEENQVEPKDEGIIELDDARDSIMNENAQE